MSVQFWLWVVFAILIVSALALDLGVFHRKGHVVGMREALIWSAAWIALALIFNWGIWIFLGGEKALLFLSAYLIEKSLSVDNIFVFLLIFSYFRVPPEYQHRVLFWGIVAAAAIRGVFIFAGVTLIAKFHWLIYVFGAFLIYTGIRMGTGKDQEVHPEKNPLLRLSRRFLLMTDDYEKGGHFLVRRQGRTYFTPLFVVLLVVETTDVVFAVDSVPAVLAITLDPFLIYSSNLFAILGLRALYFALAGVMRLFHHLHYGLSFVLVFVGVKMMIADFYKVPTAVALAIIATTVLASVVASVLMPRREASRLEEALLRPATAVADPPPTEQKEPVSG
jgi:tellurite resistance protein TerC